MFYGQINIFLILISDSVYQEGLPMEANLNRKNTNAAAKPNL